MLQCCPYYCTKHITFYILIILLNSLHFGSVQGDTTIRYMELTDKDPYLAESNLKIQILHFLLIVVLNPCKCRGAWVPILLALFSDTSFCLSWCSCYNAGLSICQAKVRVPVVTITLWGSITAQCSSEKFILPDTSVLVWLHIKAVTKCELSCRLNLCLQFRVDDYFLRECRWLVWFFRFSRECWTDQRTGSRSEACLECDDGRSQPTPAPQSTVDHSTAVYRPKKGLFTFQDWTTYFKKNHNNRVW